MWWRDRTTNRRAVLMHGVRAAAVLAAAGLTAGCFQPLYGERTLDGGPSVNTALHQIQIAQIPATNGTPEARLAVELRNQLMFGLNGNNPAPPTHRLDIRIQGQRTSVIVDTTTARADVENYGLRATYSLVDLRTGKAVISDTAYSPVSYDIPGQQQRFARERALHEAQTRAATAVAETIRNRLASYFVAGT